jgi:HSP20 family protein
MFKDIQPSLRGRSPRTRPASIADLMEEFRRDPLGALSFSGKGEFPVLDVSEDGENVTVKAELPGMDADGVEILIQENVLTIKGEKKFEEEKKGERYHLIERGYGAFSRSLALPAEVEEDKARASFVKGLLVVTLPKVGKTKVKATKIEVSLPACGLAATPEHASHPGEEDEPCDDGRAG